MVLCYSVLPELEAKLLFRGLHNPIYHCLIPYCCVSPPFGVDGCSALWHSSTQSVGQGSIYNFVRIIQPQKSSGGESTAIKCFDFRDFYGVEGIV
jgi:hypothetical protein